MDRSLHKFYSNSDLPRQPHIPRTAPHIHAKLPTRHHPLCPIPNTQIPPPQLERRSTASSHSEIDLIESSELLRRRIRTRGIPQVQLRHLGTRHTTRVGNLRGDGGHGFEEVGWATGGFGSGSGAGGWGPGYAKGVVGEVSVGWVSQLVTKQQNNLTTGRKNKSLTKTETKFVARFDVVLVEVAVVDEEVPGCVVPGCYCRAVVGRLLGDRVGKFTARGGGAVEDVYETVAGLLAWGVCQYCASSDTVWNMQTYLEDRPRRQQRRSGSRCRVPRSRVQRCG